MATLTRVHGQFRGETGARVGIGGEGYNLNEEGPRPLI